MTIEINRQDSTVTYRLNPYNNREIDVRLNRHGARWKRFESYSTPQIALAALMQLEKGTTEVETAPDLPALTIPPAVYAELVEVLDELDRAFKPTAESKNARLWVEAHGERL